MAAVSPLQNDTEVEMGVGEDKRMIWKVVIVGG